MPRPADTVKQTTKFRDLKTVTKQARIEKQHHREKTDVIRDRPQMSVFVLWNVHRVGA